MKYMLKLLCVTTIPLETNTTMSLPVTRWKKENRFISTIKSDLNLLKYMKV